MTTKYRSLFTGRLCAPAALAMLAGTACTSLAQTTLTWTNGAGGNWNNASNWSPSGIPNNSFPNTFNAVINIAGAYTVNLDINATIENFTHNPGGGAIFSLNNTNSLVVNQNMTLGSEFYGRRELGGTGTLTVFGNTTFNNGARLRRTTGATFWGNVTFANSTTDEICDTGVDHRGAFMDWNGSGNIVMGRAASITLSSASTMRINSAATFGYNGLGATGTIFNNGVIHKLSGGTSFFNRVTINNSGGGLIRVSSGILKVNQLSNLNSGNLVGGRFRSEDAGELQIVDLGDVAVEITENNATVELVGTNSRFDGINSLAVNGSEGSLTVSDGRSFTTLGDFTNAGTLTIGAEDDAGSSSFTVASGSSLTNYNAGTQTLAGGTFNLFDSSFTFDGASIRRIESNLALDGGSATILSSSGTTAFDGALTVGTAGSLGVSNRTFTTAGDLTVDGTLTVGVSGVVEVQAGSTITNIQAGTLTGGTFDLSGELRAGAGQTINVIDSDVTFNTSSAKILTDVGDDALADWSMIGGSGSFTLTGNTTYTTLSTADFSVLGAGRLAVEDGSEFVVRAGSELTNFSGGVFSGGTFDIKGTLRFQNAAVTRIENNITLDGDNAQIVDLAGNDAFAPLNTIANTGTLNVRNKLFTVGGGLTLDGALKIGTGTGPRTVGEVVVSGDLDQTGTVELDNGILTVLGQYNNFGLIRGSGLINADLQHRGGFSDGEAGTLSIQGSLTVAAGSSFTLDLINATQLGGYDQFTLFGTATFEDGAAGAIIINDATFAGTLGQVFTDVFTFNGPISGTFAQFDLAIESQDLFLQPIFTQNTISFVVVPAPGTFGLLALAGLAAGRRRRA
jgi:hypothetical protein